MPFPKVTRNDEHARARVAIGNVIVGDGHFVVLGGPCSVESRETILATADGGGSATVR